MMTRNRLGVLSLLATISDSGEAIGQESMMNVSLSPLENDSVGEISLKKQVISSISEKDGEMIRSTSIEVSISEVMNTEVLSLLEIDSTVLEEEKIGGDLKQFKETYAPNVSLSEVSKEDNRFGDYVHKIEEVQGFEQDKFISNKKDSSKHDKKVHDSDSQRLYKCLQSMFSPSCSQDLLFCCFWINQNCKQEKLQDLNGYHVIQSCLLSFGHNDNKFLLEAATKYCAEIATHSRG